jgi:hypothetical protein
MFIDKKIITSKQLRTFRAKNSTVMKDFLGKGGEELMHRKVQQKELWNDLRAESQLKSMGNRGFTKKGLTKFFGKLLINDGDNFTNKKVKKSADLFGINRSKLYSAAAEAKVEKHTIENQKRQDQQMEYQVKKQRNIETNKHISDIILKGKEKAQAGLHDSSPTSVNNSELNKGAVLTSFGRSDANIRNGQRGLACLSENKLGQNNSQISGHHSQYDFVAEEQNDAEIIKARLARIQGRVDNKDNKEKITA